MVHQRQCLALGLEAGNDLPGDLMQENFEDMEYEDSTTTNISDIMPQTDKRFRFQYEYDFGDSWNHEVLFEGMVQSVSKVKYPLCVEGERACPPEDCGGMRAYGDLAMATQPPNDEPHAESLAWVAAPAAEQESA